MTEPLRLLMLCMGNICRSPMAEGALRARLQAAGLADAVEIDSVGTGDWHAGDPPDPRAQRTALRHGSDISSYRGRQVKPADFRRFTHIVALDHDNLSNLRRLTPADGVAELSLLLDHVPGREGQPVADPYFGDEDGFEITWAEVVEGAKGLAARLRSA